ncbi:hypothetical protein [Promicromonospora iranensis]|uniref:hypothetical protein n=1 Tax=Promicromonospora iranensis TaxID=1105144 RepID=UPI0023A9F95D|nr:hypothetical protein [Promicromonospora iranensis]
MNIDRNDSGYDDNDFLSGALRGAADTMPGGEVDDLHVSFGVVRDRVRRRRAAKIGGLTGASLVLVAGIAFGATQTPLLDRGPVLPGQSESASATPSPSGAATQAPDSGPSATPARSVIEDGYAPSWIRDLGAGLECGMPVEDLEPTATGWSAAVAGDIYARTSDQDGTPSTTWGMSALVSGTEGTLDAPPVLVWSQDGVVVDLGTNVFEGSVQSAPLLSSETGDVTEAQGGAFTSCAPADGDAGQIFETPLPEGDYEVRVVAFPQVASGQWATAVSEPVEVRLDADGAHSATGTRGGDATIEPPEPAEGELSRFVLDRSTDRVTAELTQFRSVTTGTPSVTAQCESSDPDDVVRYEVVQPSINESFASGEVPCDGSTFESKPVVGGGEDVVDIRLTSVPDGVARLWATLAPNAGGGDAAGDCSADGLGLAYDPANSPSAGAGATAEAIVDAALACDSDRLVELATQYPTELLIPAEPAEQVFALPEDESLHYLTLVGLLAGTVGADQGDGTVVWPRVALDEFRDSDEAWDEVVEAGLLTQGEADAQRADAQGFGYTGMRIGIDDAGNWRYYSATP